MASHIDTRQQSGWLVLVIDGDLDLASAPTVQARLRLATAGGPPRLAVDLDAVGVLDSVGIGLLLGARRRVVEAGGEVVVVCSVERLARVLVAAGVDRLLPVVASLEEAPG